MTTTTIAYKSSTGHRGVTVDLVVKRDGRVLIDGVEQGTVVGANTGEWWCAAKYPLTKLEILRNGNLDTKAEAAQYVARAYLRHLDAQGDQAAD